MNGCAFYPLIDLNCHYIPLRMVDLFVEQKIKKTKQYEKDVRKKIHVFGSAPCEFLHEYGGANFGDGDKGN